MAQTTHHPDHDPETHRARGLDIDARVRAAVAATRQVGVSDRDLAHLAETVLRALPASERVRVISTIVDELEV